MYGHSGLQACPCVWNTGNKLLCCSVLGFFVCISTLCHGNECHIRNNYSLQSSYYRIDMKVEGLDCM